MHWVQMNISSIYYFTKIPITLKQQVQSDWITNEPRKPWGDVLRTLSVHGGWTNNENTQRPKLASGKNQPFSVPCDLEIWQMTLRNNRAPPLTYFKLWASCCRNWWIQTGVTVWKCPIWVKICDSLSPVTLKFDRWPWKTIGYLL